MSIRITVDVFSGRPNPSVELDDRESAEVLDRLMPVRRLGDTEPGLPPEPTLGYRGLVVDQIADRRAELPDVIRVAGGDVFGRGLAHRARDDRAEDYLLSRKARCAARAWTRPSWNSYRTWRSVSGKSAGPGRPSSRRSRSGRRAAAAGRCTSRPGGMCPPGSRSTTATTTRPTTAPTPSPSPGERRARCIPRSPAGR